RAHVQHPDPDLPELDCRRLRRLHCARVLRDRDGRGTRAGPGLLHGALRLPRAALYLKSTVRVALSLRSGRPSCCRSHTTSSPLRSAVAGLQDRATELRADAPVLADCSIAALPGPKRSCCTCHPPPPVQGSPCLLYAPPSRASLAGLP